MSERWSFEIQRRFDQTVSNLLHAIANAFPEGRVDPTQWEDENGRGPGCVNGRGALGEILRSAVKNGVVSVTPEQAMSLAHSGSASHYDTAATLLAASGFPIMDSEVFQKDDRVTTLTLKGTAHGIIRGVKEIKDNVIYYDVLLDDDKPNYGPHTTIPGERLSRSDD